MAEYSSNDPFRPLLSLADQKTLNLASKLTEKKLALNPSEKLDPDGGYSAAVERLRRGGAEGTGLLDIAKSSVYQGNARLFDAFHGRTTDPEELQYIADQKYGVSPEDRQRLVTNDQQEVIQSLAQGNYMDALVGGVKAAPGTLADSANVVPEIAAGAALTAATGGVAGPLIFGKKVKKGKEAVGRVGKAIEAAKNLPKTAGQMSVVTAGMTQGQIAEYEQNFGERPSPGHIAQMYGINLVTMTAEGGILKNLFVPDFKKELKAEAKAVVNNIGSGNLARFGERLGSTIKKVGAAAGAEALQEYVQTWAEIVNTSIGENEEFLSGLKRELSNADNNLQAKAGAFLGFGAGGLARGAITAPALAAGSTADVAKGTTATAVKGASKFAQNLASKASYKVLSQEERDAIDSSYQTAKVVVDKKVAEFEDSISRVKAAKTFDDLRNEEDVRPVLERRQKEQGLTDEQLRDEGVFQDFKKDIVRAYRGNIGTLRTELEARRGADYAKRSAKNVGAKSVELAEAAVKAAAPLTEDVVKAVKKYGPVVVEAVKEIRSSTGLGMIEMAKDAGTKETKQIVKAARSLSLDDLNRTTAVISKINPKLAARLRREIRIKKKALEKAGLRKKTIVTTENLPKIIKDASRTGKIIEDDIAFLSAAVSEAAVSVIDDLDTLERVEKAMTVLQNTKAFKEQTKDSGVTSKVGMENIARKLAAARKRIERDNAPDGIVSNTIKATKAAASGAKKAGEEIVKGVAQATRPGEKFQVPKELGLFMDRIAVAVNKPELAKEAMEAVPAVLEQLEKAGVETRQEFEAVVAQFPELQNNAEFFSELDHISRQESIDLDAVGHLAGRYGMTFLPE